jgi:hypothetical protein
MGIILYFLFLLIVSFPFFVLLFVLLLVVQPRKTRKALCAFVPFVAKIGNAGGGRQQRWWRRSAALVTEVS